MPSPLWQRTTREPGQSTKRRMAGSACRRRRSIACSSRWTGSRVGSAPRGWTKPVAACPRPRPWTVASAASPRTLASSTRPVSAATSAAASSSRPARRAGVSGTMTPCRIDLRRSVPRLGVRRRAAMVRLFAGRRKPPTSPTSSNRGRSRRLRMSPRTPNSGTADQVALDVEGVEDRGVSWSAGSRSPGQRLHRQPPGSMRWTWR